MNCWQRITNYFDLHSAACASNCWPSGSVLIDLARDETSPHRNVTFPSKNWIRFSHWNWEVARQLTADAKHPLRRGEKKQITQATILLAAGDSDVLCTIREQKHLLHHRSHCRCHHRPQSARPVLAQQWRYFPAHAFSLIYSAHANAAIAHDINVSFQGDRRIVCFPGDA